MGTSCAKEKPSRRGSPSNEPQIIGVGIEERLPQNEILPASPVFFMKKAKSRSDEIVTSFEDIRKIYEFEPNILGHGHYGTVRLASLVKNKTKKFAVKSISKQKIKKDLHLFRRELEILKSLDHPNVIKFYETYQDNKHFHLVMEYCSGGELLERIARDKMISEAQTSRILKKILIGVKYLHQKGICHRDIKLENFLFSSSAEDSEIKIIDFGLSTYILNEGELLRESQEKFQKEFHFDNELQTMCGTALYLAPEVIKGSYDQRCDIWSIGIMLYTLLSGELPFIGSTNSEIFEKVLNHRKLDFSSESWKKISKEAKDLVRKLLVIDPNNRITLDQALKHPWLKMNIQQRMPLGANETDQRLLNILRHCSGTAKFKKEALKVLVNFLEEDEIKELKQIFRKIDVKHTGMITIEELRSALIQIGVSNTEEEIKNIMKTVYVNEQSRQINYSSFIAATLDEKKLCNKERLWNVFKHFDIDDTNYITVANLRDVLARAGRKVDNEELHEIMNEVDHQQNQRIGWKEFVEIMTQTNHGSQCNLNTSNNDAEMKDPRDSSDSDVPENRCDGISQAGCPTPATMLPIRNSKKTYPSLQQEENNVLFTLNFSEESEAGVNEEKQLFDYPAKAIQPNKNQLSKLEDWRNNKETN